MSISTGKMIKYNKIYGNILKQTLLWAVDGSVILTKAINSIETKLFT